MGRKLECVFFCYVTVFLLCYTLVQGGKLDETNTIFGGQVDSREAQFVGRKLATKATIDRPADHGGGQGRDKSSNDKGGQGASTGVGGSNGDGEVNGGVNGGEVKGSSGCLSVGGGLVTLCGKGVAFLVLVFVIVVMNLCSIACNKVCFRRGD